jgi:membrane fusion protein, multidrug efflux system
MFLFLLHISCSDSSDSSDNKKKSDETTHKKKEGNRRGGYGGWGKESVEEPSLLIESALVSMGNVSSYLQLTGTLESEYTVSVVPEMTGTCSYVYVREGDKVKKGDPLAQLTNRSVDASAERAGIELERSKREYSKIEVLYKKGVVSSRDYQEAQTAFKTAQTSFEEAQKNKGATTITSPIDGVVSIVGAQAGEQIGTTQAFQLIDPLNLRLIVAVPERDLSSIHTGQHVEIYSAYDESQNIVAEVERIGPIIDPTNGSVKLFIDLPSLNDENMLFRAGQFVRAEVELDTHENTKLIPKSALVYQDGQPIVYRVVLQKEEPKEKSTEEDFPSEEDKGWFASWFGSDEPISEKDNLIAEKKDEDPSEDAQNKENSENKDEPSFIAQRTEIELGYIDTRMIEVLSGLELGDEIVTIGNTNLRQDTPIRIKSKESLNKEGNDETSGQEVTSLEEETAQENTTENSKKEIEQ